RESEWLIHSSSFLGKRHPGFCERADLRPDLSDRFQRNGKRRRRDLWRSLQPTAPLSELEPLDPALDHSFVSRDGGIRGKQWQTASRAAQPRHLFKSVGSQIFGPGESAHPNSDSRQRYGGSSHSAGSQAAVRQLLGDNRSNVAPVSSV